MAPAAKAPPPPPPMRLVTPAPPVPPWTQRTEDLERIVVMLRTGLPVDRAFDDVTAVFGEGADPAEDDIPVLVERPFRLGAAAYRPRDEDLAHDLIAHIATWGPPAWRYRG